MRLKFIQNLEPFIISGQFKKETIPENILNEFLEFWGTKDENHTNKKNLERIVQ